MSLNPVLTSQKVFERYVSYITTTFMLKDKTLNQQIDSALNEKSRFSKGPIIEATPPFETGKSLRQLMDEGVLTNAFADLQSTSLPVDRSLYLHQEQTIRKICHEKRNAVVATGTGSGKTESFIIPILNYLLTQKQQNQLTPGVRALLLYPMNALANDQMKRLRELLKNRPEITFGIYTGETEEKYHSGYEKYKRMHQQQPLPNELISREQMKKTPPHILLTNYAMLEYLMLRPADNVFFQGPYSNQWKFVVIDEAHTYTGAKGIEMAMLIARLKSTIGIETGHLSCIMTSASLGNGREDFGLVSDFASKIFREPFDTGDVIEATKKTFVQSKVWGIPAVNIYENINLWLESVERDQERLTDILKEGRVPESVIDQAFGEESGNLIGVLYLIMSGDERVDQTIRCLVNGPMALEELAQKLSRMDFLKKVMSKSGADVENESVRTLLDILMQSLTNARSPLVKFMKNEQIPGIGKIYKLDPRIYTVAPGTNNLNLTYYRCDTCFKITKTNLRHVCPTYRCDGTLHAIDMDEKLRDNHYRNLYQNIKPENMKASEHTAQLTTEYAASSKSLYQW